MVPIVIKQAARGAVDVVHQTGVKDGVYRGGALHGFEKIMLIAVNQSW